MLRRLLTAGTVMFVVVAMAACQDGDLLQPEDSELSTTEAVTSQSLELSDCDLTVPDDHGTVQDAVGAASPGATVCVDGGTYREQVVIDKNLALVGFDEATLEMPDDPDDFMIPESDGSTWEPVVFAHGGTASGGDVSGTGIVQVDVQGLAVDGRDLQQAAIRKVGILYRNGEGTVSSNTVRDMGVGGGETFGILAYGDSDVTIADNTVNGYERGGIGANGDGGAHPAPVVEITGNEVTGSGDGSGTAWGPNGIQIGYGAAGSIVRNTVEQNRYSSTSPVASCIIVFESDDVQVQHNEVRDCDAGVTAGSWAWFAPSTDNLKLQHNTIDDALFGAYLEVVAAAGVSSAGPSVSNAKILNNRLDGGSLGEVGIQVSVFDLHEDFDPIADNNKIIRNRISSFDTPVQDGGSDSKQQANAIQP